MRVAGKPADSAQLATGSADGRDLVGCGLPWCSVGKCHFEAALSRFSHADEMPIEWRSFELDPRAPTLRNMTMDEMLQPKYGMTEEQAVAANQKMTALAAGAGLDFHLDKAQMGNTFDAHRLVHLVTFHGLGDALKERLIAPYFTEGRSIGEPAALQDLAVEVGLDPAEVEPPSPRTPTHPTCVGTKRVLGPSA
jgi:predicted DsbA family dithiol-disulfide isomerase